MPSNVLYFIHGYKSSPTGDKAVLFKKTLHAIPITYRNCPPEDLDIHDALARIKDTIANDHDVRLIGSSLGGYLAAATAQHDHQVTKIALLNPATIPPDVDIETIHDMPQSILKDMIDPTLFSSRLTIPVLIIRGIQDSVVPDYWVESFARAQHATVIYLEDDHQLTRHLQHLPAVLDHFFSQ